MTQPQSPPRPEPRVFKGFRDVFSSDLLLKRRLVDTVRGVYERYGFVPLETPSIEFVDVLGKFLPESAQPDGGIFSFRNPDLEKPKPGDPDEWLALRYDLTAPLARVCAMHQQNLPKPFRRYQVGTVWRYEKPGPGRFREFTQFDFDSVGTPGVIADAEACAIVCDAFEALGFARGDYQVRVNDRKVLAGVLAAAGLDPNAFADAASQTGTALRAIDKLDRLGIQGVIQLLGKGRKDDSGDYTEGANLDAKQIDLIVSFLRMPAGERASVCEALDTLIGGNELGKAGVDELREIDRHLAALGRDSKDVAFDPTIVRGLGYYTGPVFEGVLLKELTDESGEKRRFGSVFGGGRYDGLVERFTGTKVPATGGSIGVDRMLEALKLLNPARPSATTQVLVVVVDRERVPWYLETARKLRLSGVNTEVYTGEGGMRAQFKYADKLGIPFALIAGGNELDKGVVQIKDLALGTAAAAQGGEAVSRDDWRAGRVSQREVPVGEAITTLVELTRQDAAR